jgi:glucose-6-phosphate 1-dehydrogenase
MMPTDKVDALVIFGATGDLAKLETFPALVGLVDRGVLDVPVIGVAKSGWGLEQFRNYATDSLKLNKMDPSTPAATKMLSLLRYVDGDLGDPSTYKEMSDAVGQGKNVLFYMEVPPPLFRHLRGRPGKQRPGHGRKAIRQRSGQLSAAEPVDGEVLPGAGDLPR